MTHKITREYEKKMSEISPFELKNILIDLADESARKSTHIMLNAGRGNPNCKGGKTKRVKTGLNKKLLIAL